jgi:hypothetical protein
MRDVAHRVRTLALRAHGRRRRNLSRAAVVALSVPVSDVGETKSGRRMSSDGDDDKPSRANASEIARLLTDPDTLKFLAAQRGISLEEATERVREIIAALERAGKV